MFQTAVRLNMGYTRPVVISMLYDTGEVQCSIGAFIILNKDGWALTCHHMLDTLRQATKDAQAIADRDKNLDQIRNDPLLSTAQRKKQVNDLRINRKSITKHSYWWGQDGARIADTYYALPLADLALFQLDGFDTSQIPNFPVFGNQANPIFPGASLCKLGFPFSEVTASWDSARNSFTLSKDALPPPFFSLEGMYTRDCIFVDSQTNATARYLETSSPGLKGQSGGPTFDRSGVIWAIQSHTSTLDIGFDAKILRNGRQVIEHQAMSVGLGASIEEIMRLINAHQVDVQTQP